MNWNAIDAVGEIVGALAVASLLYLAVEVRQHSRELRSAASDAAVKSLVDWMDEPAVPDPDLPSKHELVRSLRPAAS